MSYMTQRGGEEQGVRDQVVMRRDKKRRDDLMLLDVCKVSCFKWCR